MTQFDMLRANKWYKIQMDSDVSPNKFSIRNIKTHKVFWTLYLARQARTILSRRPKFPFSIYPPLNNASVTCCMASGPSFSASFSISLHTGKLVVLSAGDDWFLISERLAKDCKSSKASGTIRNQWDVRWELNVTQFEDFIAWVDNALLPVWHRAIIWTNSGLLLIGHIGTNFSEIWNKKINDFHSKKFIWTAVCRLAAISSWPRAQWVYL